MSASLVGSEMCIRDRFHPGGKRASAPHARKESRSCRLLTAFAHCCKAWTCLLYTSDAADDM
eukprot:15265852-Alexandrium_andersonii.AAC.1